MPKVDEPITMLHLISTRNRKEKAVFLRLVSFVPLPRMINFETVDTAVFRVINGLIFVYISGLLLTGFLEWLSILSKLFTLKTKNNNKAKLTPRCIMEQNHVIH